jgi:ATP-dependent Clp protease adaptor protein ClpS
MSDDKNKPKWEENLGVKEHPKTKKPQRYKVLLHNDDYTSMEFVVAILTQVFRLGHEKATQIMLHVHTRGIGVCGVYTFDVAQTKVNQVTKLARDNEMPLKCTMEPT